MNIHIMWIELKSIIDSFDFAALGRQVDLHWYKNEQMNIVE